MLTRLYIHNFRCFVNFELKLTSRQLILGSNGAGKSSLLDAILWLRQFVTNGPAAQSFPVLNQRTKWLNLPGMTFEIEASIAEDLFIYRLEVEPDRDGPLARVAVERLTCNGNLLIEFTSGNIRLRNDRLEEQSRYEFDPHWSSLSTVMPRVDNQRLTRFKEWISNLYCFRLDPFSMTARSDAENLLPNVNLNNFASWYRHLVQAYPEQAAGLYKSLAAAIDGFRFLRLVEAGQGVRLLAAQFGRDKELHEYFFNELSDGQRCLICLYTIQHFILSRGACVVIDEPENFVSLREIQPWLLATEDRIEQDGAQVVLISHHPEIINQWAPSDGINLIREESGIVRAQPFLADEHAHLPAAELIARGWDSVSNPSLVIVLAEDKLHQRFIHRFLKRRGFDAHATRFVAVPAGKQCGEQWVRDEYANQVRAFRARAAKAETALLVIIDADKHTVEHRANQLRETLDAAGVERRGTAERIAHLIPRRSNRYVDPLSRRRSRR